jgi:hypothetical protein
MTIVQIHSTSGLAVETLLKSDVIPEKIKHSFRRTVGCMQSGEEVVWREVSARMTLDAFGITPECTRVFDGMSAYKFTCYRKIVMEARTWFTSRFEAVDCEEVFVRWGGNLDTVRAFVRNLEAVTEPQNMRAKSSSKKFETVAKAA